LPLGFSEGARLGSYSDRSEEMAFSPDGMSGLEKIVGQGMEKPTISPE
jgi:hypothetical protein